MSEIIRPGIDYIGTTTSFYCNDGKGNFLVHRRGENARDEKGVWDFGGGEVDFGEQVDEAVLREVKEEWGVEGIIQEQIPSVSILRTFDEKETHWIAIPFFIKVYVNKARIMEPHKFSEMKIVRLTNLPQPFHSGARQTMAKLQEYFDKYR